MVARRGAAASGAVVALLAACGGGGKQQHAEVVIGRDTASGKHATASASADGGLRSRFSTRVTARPNQRVTGGWIISCRNGGLASRDAEDFRGRTPISVRMGTEQAEGSHLLAGGGKCDVIATASLTRAGRVTVEVLGGK